MGLWHSSQITFNEGEPEAKIAKSEEVKLPQDSIVNMVDKTLILSHWEANILVTRKTTEALKAWRPLLTKKLSRFSRNSKIVCTESLHLTHGLPKQRAASQSIRTPGGPTLPDSAKLKANWRQTWIKLMT